MIRHVWSVLCSQVFQDAETNDLAMTVLEGFAMSAEPTASADERRIVLGVGFELLTAWVSDTEASTVTYDVRVIGPSGKLLAANPIEIPPFVAPALRNRSRVRFPGLVYDGLGIYWFKVVRELDGAEVVEAEVPVSVSIAPDPALAIAAQT
jgi:hypothetical protein